MRRSVLSVGDLHLENFGTWRDADGRLVWGVNDFDEAAVMPYVLDLVRLVTSIQLAPRSRRSSNQARRQRRAQGLSRGPRSTRSRRCCSKAKPGCDPMPSPPKGKPEKFWKTSMTIRNMQAAAQRLPRR